LLDALPKDFGKLIGESERPKGFVGMQEHFAMGAARPTITKVIRQAIAHAGRKVLFERTSPLDGSEVDSLS